MHSQRLAVSSLLHLKNELHGATIKPQKTSTHKHEYWQPKDIGNLLVRGKNAEFNINEHCT